MDERQNMHRNRAALERMMEIVTRIVLSGTLFTLARSMSRARRVSANGAASGSSGEGEFIEER